MRRIDFITFAASVLGVRALSLKACLPIERGHAYTRDHLTSNNFCSNGLPSIHGTKALCALTAPSPDAPTADQKQQGPNDLACVE
jgi:hypothetical protein